MIQRRRTDLASLLAGGILILGHASCVSTITPPADPREPATVFFRSEAMHRALLLPRAQGGFVEYGFGDYDWYGLEQDRWVNVFDTVLWPTTGTLVRRIVDVDDLDGLKANYPLSTLAPMAVERTAVTRLERRLAEQYARHESGELYNATYAMSFVESEDGFWFLYNCNDALADWLRELGCSVSFVPVRLGLSLRDARKGTSSPDAPPPG